MIYNSARTTGAQVNIEARNGNIYLIENKPRNSPGDIQHSFPQRNICICDFAIIGSELGQLGDCFETIYQGLLIIDHHIPIPQMQTRLTSTIIANNYVRKYGPVDEDYTVVINHTDTDSILSALVMTGRLAASEALENASLAADHTGEENLLSDALQALEDDRELEKSLSVAIKITACAESLVQMPDVLNKIHEKRGSVRQALREKVQQRAFKWQGDIAWIVMDGKVDAALAPALLPEAGVIVIASLMPPGSEKSWRIRVRLGAHVQGIDLSQLNLPDSGGRWNAVSTSRHGGTNIDPQTYVDILTDKLTRFTISSI